MVSLSQMSLEPKRGPEFAIVNQKKKRAKCGGASEMMRHRETMPRNPQLDISTLNARKAVMEGALRPYFGKEICINSYLLPIVHSDDVEYQTEHITLSNPPFMAYCRDDLDDDMIPVFSMVLIWDASYALTICVTPPRDKTLIAFANAQSDVMSKMIGESLDRNYLNSLKCHMHRKILTVADFYHHALPVLATMAGIIFRYSMLRARLAELYPRHTVVSSNKLSLIRVTSTNGRYIDVKFVSTHLGEKSYLAIIPDYYHCADDNDRCVNRMQSILAEYYVDPLFFQTTTDDNGVRHTLQRFKRADEIKPLCDAFAVVEEQNLAY